MAKLSDHHTHFDSTGERAVFDIITLWPHRSLSRRGFTILVLILAGLAFLIGLGFFLIGAWPVIGFMGLELAVLYFAFHLNYRDGKTAEQVLIHEKGVDVVTIAPNGTHKAQSFDSHWLTAELIANRGKRKTLALRHHHHHHEIGAFLPPSEKPAIKDLINERLGAARLRA
ncbi:MAG: DUF2244 domain-containing protein [Candidatus Puniceispirillaceae bacterium]